MIALVKLFVELSARTLASAVVDVLKRKPAPQAEPAPQGEPRTYQQTQAVEAQIRSATSFKVADTNKGKGNVKVHE